MHDSAEYIAASYGAHTGVARRRQRNLLSQAPVRSALIEVGGIRPEHPREMTLVEDEDMVQARFSR
jgi:hypothetical protein